MKKQKIQTFNRNFNVEKIVDRKLEGDRYFYLIKWQGFSHTNNTWEPIEHLENVLEMVNKYNATKDHINPDTLKTQLLRRISEFFDRYIIEEEQQLEPPKEICLSDYEKEDESQESGEVQEVEVEEQNQQNQAVQVENQIQHVSLMGRQNHQLTQGFFWDHQNAYTSNIQY